MSAAVNAPAASVLGSLRDVALDVLSTGDECLCDEVAPSDRPCLVCDAREVVSGEVQS